MPRIVLISIFLVMGLQACRQAESLILNDQSAFSQSDHFWTAAESDTAVQEGLVGLVSTEALTPLVFDAKGHLLTVDEFNTGLQKDNPNWQTYFTDLSTFREVIADLVATGNQTEKRLTDAVAENTVQLPYNEDATVFIYVYDPCERR